MPHNKMTALTIHLPFVGFTYTNNSMISDNPPCLATSDSGGGGGSERRRKESVDNRNLIKEENSRLLVEVENLKKQASTAAGSGKSADGKGYV